MQKSKFFSLFSFLLLFLLGNHLFAQETLVVNSLNTFIKPIKTLKADSSFEDIDFLKERLKEKQIIALGEVTHGTKEIYAYKDRLIRYLVTQLNYKNIAFEADYNGLMLIDNYINGKTDSTAMSPSYRPLFNWLRAYNQTKDVQNKVHVYGLEMREFNMAIDRILESYPDLTEQDKEILLAIKRTPFDQIDKERLARFRMVCTRLPNNLQQKMLIQLIDNYYNFTGNGKIGFRDKFMAENAIAIKEINPHQKLIIWAHNGHVAKSALYGKPAMGTYLVKAYGDQYQVIATDINKGNVSVRKVDGQNKAVSEWQPLYYPEVNTNKAYEYYFKQCKYKNFILDVKEALTDQQLHSFLTQQKEMRMIGGFSFPVNKKLAIANNFDLVVYFDETNNI